MEETWRVGGCRWSSVPFFTANSKNDISDVVIEACVIHKAWTSLTEPLVVYVDDLLQMFAFVSFLNLLSFPCFHVVFEPVTAHLHNKCDFNVVQHEELLKTLILSCFLQVSVVLKVIRWQVKTITPKISISGVIIHLCSPARLLEALVLWVLIWPTSWWWTATKWPWSTTSSPGERGMWSTGSATKTLNSSITMWWSLFTLKVS